MEHWTLPKYSPRPEQIRIIDEVDYALEAGYTNVVLEAGVGVGKSAIATTIARSMPSTYILTMTKQLQKQYLHDFKPYLAEIKGRSNYPCNFNGGTCEDCFISKENDKRKNIGKKKRSLCTDCRYKMALQTAKNSQVVLTNYDYLFYAGNYAKQFGTRDLLVMDEAHNFEKKVMSLVSENLSRRQIMQMFGFDIFEKVMNGEPLKNIKTNEYWIEIVNKCIEKNDELYDIGHYFTFKGKYVEYTTEKYNANYQKYHRMLKKLYSENYLIDLPLKKNILADTEFDMYLQMTLKPLTITDESSQLLDFGKQRLFMTGTLGSFEKFCEWNGLDVEESYYIYQKSPFPVENRPIFKKYVCSMKQEAWKNPHLIKYIQRILDEHKNEKGLIHVASNQQAWWLKKQLNSPQIWVAQGKTRSETIDKFEKTQKPVTLIGASIKDGVDFKGDKCRYQILFKIPFPGLHDEQIKQRKRLDESWYIYHTVQPLQQAYGRGVRDMDDYCDFYVLDMDFEQLLVDYGYLFNEYFLESIQ